MPEKIKQPVHIHINELIFSGFEHLDRRQLRETLINELSRLIAQEGLSRALNFSGYIGQLDGGSFQVTNKSAARAIGVDLAKILYGSFKT